MRDYLELWGEELGVGWRWFGETVEHMKDGQPGMVEEHTGVGNFFYFGSHRFAVAVDGAFGTDRFLFLIGTAMQALLGVLKELLALRAKFLFSGAVEVVAVEANHGRDGLGFAAESRLFLEEGVPVELKGEVVGMPFSQ